MIGIPEISGKRIASCALAAALFVPLSTVNAKGFKVLYTFCSQNDCDDGAGPKAGLIADKKGNLFGTTYVGGGLADAGTVFELASNGAETVLHSFTQSPDGSLPQAGLITDKGDLYGTTSLGGSADYGAVFKLEPPSQGQTGWTETVLYSFTGSADGNLPIASLIADKTGNLYGTTYGGGADGVGVVFQVAPDGTETVLYSFTGGLGSGNDGGVPSAGLLADKAGDLYGTTSLGGTDDDGTVFKLAPPSEGQTEWTETVLHSFAGSDGSNPVAILVTDGNGNLYGTTEYGGVSSAGVVFQIAQAGTYKTLYSFTGGADGSRPLAGLLIDTAGDLYGTTIGGGANSAGTVFKLSYHGGNWTEKVLHSFTGGRDGGNPWAGVIIDKKGDLYGTAAYGGASTNCEGCGVIFKLKK